MLQFMFERPGHLCKLALLMVILGACASALPTRAAPFTLGVANIDGPPVTLEINGQEFGPYVCVLSGGSGPRLRPSSDLPLPWKVRVLRSDGTVMGEYQEDGQRGPRAILIRGYEASEGASEDTGGGPVPQGTCAPDR